MDKSLTNKIKALAIFGILIVFVAFVKWFFQGEFNSVESLQAFMRKFGVFGPLALVLFQAFQVVVPVFPGYLGCAVGAVMFGTWTGFWCNYIGISLGSIIAYFLARKYGIDIVLAMFSEKLYNKWAKRIEKSRSYDVFLFIATVLPMFPDDFLCYFSGLIKMNAKKFIWIILLGKPWCILAYSIGFGLIK